MRAFFGPGGPLEQALPGFEPRPAQTALAEHVEEAVASGEHLLAEAGTGIGKSLAYLVPALRSGRRVVISTATKALQGQLVSKDVPVAVQALGREVRCALLKGRENYLCRRSLHSLELLSSSSHGFFQTPGDATQFEQLQDWMGMTETGDRAELPFEVSATLWTELAVGSDRCRRQSCPFVATCFTEVAREGACEAELVIANHALYFADVALRGSSGEGIGLLPEHDVVVFDEAHRLEEAAALWFGGRVSVAGIRQLVRDTERICREHARTPPARVLACLERVAAAAIKSVGPEVGRRRLTESDVQATSEQWQGFREALVRLAERLQGLGEDFDGLARRVRSSADDLEACLATNDFDRVSWAEPGAVAWAPVDVSDLLKRRLWGLPLTAVLCSATLEPRFARGRLGLEEASEVVLPSPFDYREQALLYVPSALPEPRRPGYYDALANEIVALARLSRGRALILTSSYRALDELAERIEGRLSYPVLRQGEAPRERLLERFRDSVDSVLVATSTFWQGIDVQGESLSLLVIDKLPFSAPDDPLVEARCERIARSGGDWFSDYALPSAVLRLRQGFGRLIRSHGDEGVVAILDTRLRTRPYGRRFLDALPPCRLTEEASAVADFFGAGFRATA